MAWFDRRESTRSPEADALGAAAARGEALPLTAFQDAIMTAETLFPGTPAFNIGGFVRIPGKLDHGAFRKALAQLAAELPAAAVQLERNGDGTFRQLISRESGLSAPEIVRVASDDEAQRTMAEHLERPFALQEEPLCRMNLYESDEGDSYVYVKMHHAIGDGYSIKLIGERASQLYTGHLAGHPEPLRVMPELLSTFLAGEREYLASRRSHRAVEFWREKLARTPGSRGFATVFHGSGERSLRYERHAFRVPEELFQDVQRFAKENGSTAFVVLVSALYVLNRVLDNDDFVAGISTLLRPTPALRASVGPFLGVMPFVCETTGSMSFREIVAKVGRGLRDCAKHRAMPVQALQQGLGLKERLYRIGVSYQKFKYEATFGAPHGELCFLPNHSQHEDLVFHFLHDRAGAGVQLLVDGRCDQLGEREIRTIGERYVSLLSECIAAPRIKVADVEPASEQARVHILQDLNGTWRPFPADKTVVDLIDEQASRTPAATAVHGGDGSLTYGELVARSAALARHLTRSCSDRTVGVYMERSAALVVALHGIVRAGKAYVPISTEFPKGRVEFMHRNAEFGTVITAPELAERVRELCPGADVLSVDLALSAVPAADGVPAPRVHPDGWAYVIYTSGSTGQPKGVVNVHRSLLNRLLWQQREIPIGAGDVVLQKTPYTFDVSVWELFWPFMTGATLRMLEPNGHREPRAVLAAIAEHGITTLHFVPSMLRLFIEVLAPGAAPTLRQVIVSGEELPVDVQNAFLERSGAQLYNLYGPTEAAIDVTSWKCAPEERRTSVPIGRPVDNTQILVLNRFERLLPVGVVGEIHIGGCNVSLGYIGNPELTRQKFVPNPFGKGHLYKTGDLGKWSHDRVVDYHGRIDGQLKVNGVRIELGEIDSHLKALAWVADAKTVARTLNTSKSLVSFCVFRRGAGPADELIRRTREALRERLPASMMPSSIVRIDAIPVSPNGKADVGRLVKLAPEVDAHGYVAPSTPEEREVAALMARILGVERFGVTDDFFARGGTSLLAIAFVTKYGKIGLQQFYAGPTVRGVLGGSSAVERRLARVAPRTRSNVAVLFVPYGGGNVFVYNEVATAMRRGGSSANMFAIDVPRSEETLEQVASHLAGDMAAEGLLAPSTRIVLFGHCVGSALATAIGLELQRRGKRVEALVAGGYIPGLPRVVSSLEHLVQRFIYRRDHRIKWFMRRIGFHNAAALESVDVRPMLEDFRIDGTRAREFYRRSRDEKLEAELHLLLGEKDPLTRHVERYHAGWRRYVSGAMSVLRIGGAKHYFVHQEAAVVARFLNGVVAEHEPRAVDADAEQAA